LKLITTSLLVKKNAVWCSLLMPATIDEESPWFIPEADCSDTTEGHEANAAALKRMQKKFPLLHCILKYPITVQKPVNTDEDTLDMKKYRALCAKNTYGEPVYNREVPLSFHVLAGKFMVAMCSGIKHDTLISSSSHSLRAIHIIALALRGVVVGVLDKTKVVDTELAASRNVTTAPIDATFDWFY